MSIYQKNEVKEVETSRTLSLVVDNQPGTLARVIGLFSGRGYNIESLTVTEIDNIRNLSRISTTIRVFGHTGSTCGEPRARGNSATRRWWRFSQKDVACTRAKEDLYLLGTEKRKSKFFSEISESRYTKLDIKETFESSSLKPSFDFKYFISAPLQILLSLFPISLLGNCHSQTTFPDMLTSTILFLPVTVSTKATDRLSEEGSLVTTSNNFSAERVLGMMLIVNDIIKISSRFFI